MKDTEFIKTINSMDHNTLLSYSKNYIAVDLKHYLTLQIEWLKTEKYFTGINLDKQPTEDEILQSWIVHNNPERFRAFYVLKYPDMVEKNKT